ncbi:unnamed protein product [Candidula unifasciata]|uniref:Innexin n=1 Tax=Candidula unifasciata TaxID=100452 RepID=A0A8S3ZQE4_9EUPU|nr:unnamed protein product [Candidula unifasciata]
METFINTLTGLKIKSRIRDDDTIDQLHHFITVYLLAAFALLIGIKEYTVGQLDCWFSNVTLKHFQEHVNTYCWTHKLYRYPNPDNLSEVPYTLSPEHGGPSNSTILDHDTGEINFYRWITVVFLCQAFMFKLPHLIWTECNEYSGTQIEKMVTMIGSCSFDTQDKKNTMFASVAEFLEIWLKINRKPFWFMKSRVGRETKKILQHWMLCVGANTGNYLSTMYVIVKAMFLVNVFLQFFILTSFLDFDYWGYGIRVIKIFYYDPDKIDHLHFPRVALCHFQVRSQGYWVQCLLTINMLLEKLFVVEWFWLSFLLILTFINFIVWCLRILRTDRSVKFVSKYLTLLNEDGSLPQEGKRTAMTFVRDYLGNDGVFILRIIATNTNDVVINIAVRPDSVSKEPAPSVDTTLDDLDKNELAVNSGKASSELHIG